MIAGSKPGVVSQVVPEGLGLGHHIPATNVRGRRMRPLFGTWYKMKRVQAGDLR